MQIYLHMSQKSSNFAQNFERTMMRKNYFSRTCAVMMTLLLLTACEKATEPQPKDPREAFIGNYSFYSSGSVDLYADSAKIGSYPMNEEGEMSIAPATEPNDVMVIAENDTSVGHIADGYLLIEPTTAVEKFGKMDMNLSFTYGKAALNNRVLTFPTNVSITATYQDVTFSGYGQVDIVAIKK